MINSPMRVAGEDIADRLSRARLPDRGMIRRRSHEPAPIPCGVGPMRRLRNTPPTVGLSYAAAAEEENMETMKTEATTPPPGRLDSPNHLIGSDRVEGTSVINGNGVKLGTIERVMIDKLSGQVMYAVMSSGGFLGMGESYHPLPWGVLNYNPEEGSYVVDLDRDRLQGAPYYTAADQPDWSDAAWNRRLHDHYGVSYATL
jgi:hypothetical protein